MLRPRSCADVRSERGSASLEFLGVGVLLLVPLFYLVMTLGALQAATFATSAAARESVRAYTSALDAPSAERAVETAVHVALADFDIPVGAATVDLRCDRAVSCFAPDELVSVTVTTVVALPFVPAVFGESRIGIPVEATAGDRVDRFAAADGLRP